jgi:hypothetical protein
MPKARMSPSGRLGILNLQKVSLQALENCVENFGIGGGWQVQVDGVPEVQSDRLSGSA